MILTEYEKLSTDKKIRSYLFPSVKGRWTNTQRYMVNKFKDEIMFPKLAKLEPKPPDIDKKEFDVMVESLLKVVDQLIKLKA